MRNKHPKRRREFCLQDAAGETLARGVLYDEGNVQILWRVDIGWTAEQYASIATTLDLLPNIRRLTLKC